MQYVGKLKNTLFHLIQFLAEMLGSTEILKQDIDYHWATPEEPTPDESA